jgi:crotonobetainyl-CoA:carnitine CoA-transferase CaiB-like acyl-CoA transferase
MSAAGAFAGLRVVEHTQHLAGAFAGRMFAAMGAEVISVGPDAAGDATFWHLSAGKRLAEADESTPGGRALVADLLDSGPDVWICDTLREADTVAARPGGTIAAAVSDFGESGPRRDWRGSEMIHQALSGVMGQTGEAGREPLFGLSSRAYSATGVALFGSIVARLFARERHRGGPDGSPAGEPPLEVTVNETAASMGQNEVATYGYSGTWPRRGRYPGLVGRVPCRDGWVVVFGLGRWDVICRAFRCPELAADERFALVPDRIAHWRTALAMLADAARGLTRDEVVTAAQAEHATVEHINTLADLRRSAHLAQRGFWREGAPGDDGPGIALGPMFRVRSRPGWITAPARPAEAGSAEAGSAKAGEVRAGPAEAGQVRVGSAEAGQVRAGSAEAGSAEAGEP